MSLTRLTVFIALHILQGIHGQQNNLSSGQNNLSQLLQNNAAKSSDCLNQSTGNLASNLNIQPSVNLQSLISQSPSLAATFSLQPQAFAQPINLQLSPITNLQQSANLQQSGNLQQSSIPQQPPTLQQQPALQQVSNLQQPCSLQQSSNLAPSLNSVENLFLQQPQSSIAQQPHNSYLPINIQQIPYVQSFNPQQFSFPDSNIYQQPIVTSLVQSTQSPQSFSMPSATFISALPSIPSVPSCAYQRSDISNLGPNYVQPTPNVQYTFVEAPQVASYSTLPRIAVLSSPSIVPSASNPIMSYRNQGLDVVESPLRVSNDFIRDENISCEQDDLTSLVLSLLQNSNNPSAYASPSGYSVNPYAPSYLNQGSKSSTFKVLLPLILNLLKERREDCGCHANCQRCERRNKSIKEKEPQVYGGYSKKREYGIKDDMFKKGESKVQNPKIVKAHKNLRKMKNSIPDISDESYEHDIEDYDGLSEEEVD